MDWRILARLSRGFYILSQARDSRVRYAPLYVMQFPLNARHAQIRNIPDRLRWLRCSKGLLQKEVDAIAGISRSAYTELESGRAK